MENSTGADTNANGASLRRPSPISTTSASSSASPAPRRPNGLDAAARTAPPPGIGSPETPAIGFPPDAASYPGQTRSLAGIALRAFCLGAALVVGVVSGTLLVLLPRLVPGVPGAGAGIDVLAPLWRLPFFLAALATFHFLEFWTTARYNTQAASIDSFLLTANWPAYAIAHTAASVECLLRYTLLRDVHVWTHLPFALPRTAVLATGLAVVVIGQAVRTAAMVQAGRSFNHTIQHKRATSHALVTDGVYAWLRHPSYFGFFWWALGTQLVLGNVVCLAAYAVVLWRFFFMRIRHEETLLVRFFGDDYVQYRARVGTKIPFI
ncbi:protein-S-isoprenylcysteine O-methyltransferase [Sporothrix schenckii 1099-18]|uniref:Protein-S-isoprenylcysteine O-methyltransferase n=1 Tax=Sporothrix schenckii 1099-18 TaxID=1397361 RepID=A0A0F2M9V8_SPOSC|nr:protein-S-isoprenylcysteine O-methyltransferase [Sporothrix schenckii 1099-18]KJR86468.1 protein-S-isoprenylcysteine O-methyltransferase [Sporothrix schenckii 1099-18]